MVIEEVTSDRDLLLEGAAVVIAVCVFLFSIGFSVDGGWVMQ